MFMRYLPSALLISLFLTHSVNAVSLQQVDEKTAETEKVKQQASRFKVGKKVVLNLRENNRRVKGTITALDGNGVTIAEKGSGQAFFAEFAQLKSIKGDGSLLTAIVVGGVAAGIVIVIVVVQGWGA